MIANKVRRRNGLVQILPLGYDRVSQRTFANRDLIINTVDYLADQQGLSALKSRVFKLRLLDKTLVNSQKNFWGIIALIVPILFLLILALLVFLSRKQLRK